MKNSFKKILKYKLKQLRLVNRQQQAYKRYTPRTILTNYILNYYLYIDIPNTKQKIFDE